jgi:hypothetical protein
MDYVTVTPLDAHSARASLACDLEWFWPSRRGHAFDELCR